MSDTAADDVDPRIERSRRVVREAALRELAESGYGAFTIDAVARRSGVARSTIYRHWPDKVAIIADAFDSLNVQPRPAPGPDGEQVAPRERVRRLLVHLAEVFRDSIFEACMPALIEAAERDPKLRAFSHEYSGRRRQALTDAIRAGLSSGDFPAHVDPELASAALAGAIMYHRLMTADRFDPSRVDDLIDSVLGPPN
jgi:TetR/AcrR family transcriptional regulator of autoinduction and epiphytic fitness